MPVKDYDPIELSVVMPCLNEAETLEACICKARRALNEGSILGEVIVADNGSTDGSIEIAERLGARVVRVQPRGYGNALMGGIAAASSKFVLMGDADGSYEFGHIPRFIEKLRAGADLVMGNRFHGGITECHALAASLPWQPRPISDRARFFPQPRRRLLLWLRAFRKGAYERMGLRTTGMEFATEMVVKATLLRMNIAEVPPPSPLMAAVVPRTSELGEMAGARCGSFCFTALAGYFFTLAWR